MSSLTDYVNRVHSRFPAPEGYRNVQHGENIPAGTRLYDRLLLMKGREFSDEFLGWSDYGDARFALRSGHGEMCTNVCWFVIPE